MKTGARGPYRFLEWRDRGLHCLLEDCPGVVAGQYLAVVAFDGGPFELGEAEERRGWTQRDEVCYSPRLAGAGSLPLSGLDEWYVFAEPKRLPGAEIFIAYPGFSLREAGADRALAQQQKRFWRQLESLAPLSYIAQGENVIFVTCDAARHAEVEAWLARSQGAKAEG